MFLSFGISSVAGFLYGVLSEFYRSQFTSALISWKISYKEGILSISIY